MKYINGLAKSGNHALAKACRLLGVPMRINHQPYVLKVPGQQYSYIVRHPKNIACSVLRTRRTYATPSSLLEAMPNALMGKTPKEVIDLFGGWVGDVDTTLIRYEDLTASEAGMKRVADWLGVPYTDQFAQLAGGTDTWTGSPSDWRMCWNDKLQAAWAAAGGTDLEKIYGYDPSEPWVTANPDFVPSTLTLVSGEIQYGTVVSVHALDGTASHALAISKEEEAAIRIDGKLAEGLQFGDMGIVRGWPTYLGQAFVTETGDLAVHLGESVNADGVPSFTYARLSPDEFRLTGAVITVSVEVAQAIHDLKPWL